MRRAESGLLDRLDEGGGGGGGGGIICYRRSDPWSHRIHYRLRFGHHGVLLLVQKSDHDLEDSLHFIESPHHRVQLDLNCIQPLSNAVQSCRNVASAMSLWSSRLCQRRGLVLDNVVRDRVVARA